MGVLKEKRFFVNVRGTAAALAKRFNLDSNHNLGVLNQSVKPSVLHLEWLHGKGGQHHFHDNARLFGGIEGLRNLYIKQ
jgi:hypothetical protein